MERDRLPLPELWRLLPDLPELEALRLMLGGASEPDPEGDRAAGYASAEKRVIARARVDALLADAKERAHEQVDALFSTLPALVSAGYSGDVEGAARLLVGLGERQEAGERLREARHSYEAALGLTLEPPERGARVLALRRIGRVALAQGDLADALLHYRRSADLAREIGDVRGEVIARTGFGNVLLLQGRWPETEQTYREAFERLEASGEGESLALERAQLLNNRAMILTHLERFEEAAGWFERALEAWRRLDSPADLAICYYNEGLMLDRQGRLEEARRGYERVFALQVPAAVRATTAIALAECLLAQGEVAEAESWAREAEDQAIASRSPYRLGHVYRGLGNLAREKGDPEASTHFERALEIARTRGYLPLEAETLLDYAQLRSEAGEREPAEALLEEAFALYRRLGIAQEKARAERILRTLAGPGDAAPPGPDGELPPGA